MSESSITIAGYQGPRSILTRGLAAFAEASLPSANLVPDVTAQGVPAAQLFSGLQTGEYHIGYMASGYLAQRVPELGVLDVPFSVGDRQHAYRALDGDAGRILRDEVRKVTGLTVLGFWDNGFRHVSNNKHPISAPDDCQGLVIRTLNNSVYMSTLSALGFKPVVTDVKELVSAVETGAVDAQENPLTNILGFGLERWHKHVSMTAHIFGVLLFVAHADWFEALLISQQRQIRESADAATSLQRRLAAEEDIRALSVLQERGVDVLVREQIDIDRFLELVDPIRKNMLETLPPKLVEAYFKGSIDNR